MSRVLCVLSLVLLSACAGTRRVRDVTTRLDPTSTATPAGLDSDRFAVAGRGAVDELPLAVAQLVRNLQRVHFETDTAQLTPAARAALDENAAILLRHPDVRIEVQGHADERGTTDYNLALGHRRAQAVQQQLQAHGVPPDRVQPTTLGEEAPLDGSGGASAWAANRRAEFRVSWGGDGVVQGSVD